MSILSFRYVAKDTIVPFVSHSFSPIDWEMVRIKCNVPNFPLKYPTWSKGPTLVLPNKRLSCNIRLASAWSAKPTKNVNCCKKH